MGQLQGGFSIMFLTWNMLKRERQKPHDGRWNPYTKTLKPLKTHVGLIFAGKMYIQYRPRGCWRLCSSGLQICSCDESGLQVRAQLGMEQDMELWDSGWVMR